MSKHSTSASASSYFGNPTEAECPSAGYATVSTYCSDAHTLGELCVYCNGCTCADESVLQPYSCCASGGFGVSSNCNGGNVILKVVEPPSVTLAVHMCSSSKSSLGDTRDPPTFKSDSGSTTTMDNDNRDDLEKGMTDSFQVPPASDSFKIDATGPDGWCVDQMTYDGMAIDICWGLGIYLDTPCTGDYGDFTCGTSLSVDVAGGHIDTSLCAAPTLKYHTCDEKWAGTDDPVYFYADGQSAVSLDVSDKDDRERDEWDSYTPTKYATSEAKITTTGGDMWCVDKLMYGAKWYTICDGKGAYLSTDSGDYRGKSRPGGSTLTMDIAAGTACV